MHFLFHTTQTQMNVNHCRICWIIIPEKFNWWPALRCSKHREKKDEELSILIEETIWLDAENDYLRNRFFDTESNYEKLNREHHKLKKRYDMLRKRHCDDVRKISESNRENARLRKWIERLFARIHVLEWRNAEWLKDYKQLKSEILSDEKWKYDKVAEEVAKL